MTVASFRHLLREGRIRPDETTVLCITGNGLKTTDAVCGIGGREFVIAPKVAEFERVVLSWLAEPEVAVPVATHTGWNLRRAEAGAENELVSLTGSYIPFPVTQAERERTGGGQRGGLPRRRIPCAARDRRRPKRFLRRAQ